MCVWNSLSDFSEARFALVDCTALIFSIFAISPMWLPPITKELLGIAKFDDEGKSYKELLQEALTKKYLE